MFYLGYESCIADPDVWIKKFTKPNGSEYYGYILLYVDDAMCINHDAVSELKKLDHYFKMKDGSIGDPHIYLGGKVSEVNIDDHGELVCTWSLSPTKYVQAAIKNVEEYLDKEFNGRKLPKKHAKGPFANGLLS